MASSALKLEVIHTLWVLSLLLLPVTASAFATEETDTTRYYQFDIRMTRATRLCATKSIVTVNDQFPGPAIVAREGDRVVVKVINHAKNNVTLHWHGVRQLRSAWADGPAYITQCPIQTGQTYVYNFTVAGQRGTLWWHAHASWLRSTLYGPIIVLPKLGVPYPFLKPYKEVPIIFGEWWKADPEAVIAEALKSGAGPNASDAYTINGLPGFSYNCSAKDTFQLKVKPGRTYLLRFINAALDQELFFSIAGHKLTVVEADAVYTKPFTTDVLHITPGQTANALLRTMPQFPNTTFAIGARAFSLGRSGSFGNSTVFGIVEYQSSDSKAFSNKKLPLIRPSLPAFKDAPFVFKFAKRFRSLADDQFPANVPRTVDRRFLFTVGIGTLKCPRNQTCLGLNGDMFAAGLNNVSFEMPTTAFLQAHFTGQSEGVYTTDFPSNPTHAFDYTGIPPNNTLLSSGTKVVVLPYNTRVELVLQDTSIVAAESHPLHLHGFNFFVVGMGIGNYDPRRDPTRFNLIDPIERNTAWVPAGGWVALRFVADNPGVWFMHCHLEVHASWGLEMAWVVVDGELPSQKLPPPPSDLPRC